MQIEDLAYLAPNNVTYYVPKMINGIEIVELVLPKAKGKALQVITRCKDCGKLKQSRLPDIKSGANHGRCKACCNLGANNGRYKHGAYLSEDMALYNKWTNIKARCGKGAYKFIGMCDAWTNSYEDFRLWSEANGYKPGLTIDRIDVRGNYEPGNCQYITLSENSSKDKFKLTERNIMEASKLREEGWQWPDIASKFCVHKDTIMRNVTKFKRGGATNANR